MPWVNAEWIMRKARDNEETDQLLVEQREFDSQTREDLFGKRGKVDSEIMAKIPPTRDSWYGPGQRRQITPGAGLREVFPDAQKGDGAVWDDIFYVMGHNNSWAPLEVLQANAEKGRQEGNRDRARIITNLE